ncbi:hypothetical protein DPMN_079433 [Dreissena polymorpha]|uniref:Uncharacterized protein n=2 Tax=Dreissena polymorpha TaxID=45954 RepID=A0A9D3YP13_DREPO|nr:hypothetical protein DPMN_079433 [Dreissena polymorpha]
MLTSVVFNVISIAFKALTVEEAETSDVRLMGEEAEIRDVRLTGEETEMSDVRLTGEETEMSDVRLTGEETEISDVRFTGEEAEMSSVRLMFPNASPLAWIVLGFRVNSMCWFWERLWQGFCVTVYRREKNANSWGRLDVIV